MKVKSTLTVMTLGLAVLMGCESLDKSVVAGAGGAAVNAGRGYRRSAIATGATGAAVATAAMGNGSRSESASRERAEPTQREVQAQKPQQAAQQKRKWTAREVAAISDDKEFWSLFKTFKQPVKNRLVLERARKMTDEKLLLEFNNLYPDYVKEQYMVEISDDKEFFAALKKTDKTTNAAVLNRAMGMEDEKLLAEFVRMYPNKAKELAEGKYYHLKTSELAEALIDNIQDPSLEGTFGMVSTPGIDKMAFHLVRHLDATARTKYLARAKENREKAAKDGVLVLDKFYIGMPVIDYVVISFEDNHPWTKEAGAVIDWLDYRADMKTDISGKDWRTAWKIKDLAFEGKCRYKYFKVKGTVDGLFEFVKKYVD